MIRNNLSRILGEKRMTQARLADLTGIRATTISYWYNDNLNQISIEHLDKICEVLDCRLCDLLEYVPSPKAHTGKNLIIEQHGNQKRKKI